MRRNVKGGNREVIAINKQHIKMIGLCEKCQEVESVEHVLL